MNIPEISINRHVFAYMLSGVIALFGIVSFNRIGIDEFPDIDLPVISVTTTLSGADPKIIDATVTNIIETAVNSTPGIEHIHSKSAPSVSVVSIQFHMDKDIDVAFNEVQTKINQVLRDLPREADPPVIGKIEFSAKPVLWLTLQGDRTLQQLNQYARLEVKKRLESIDGVGEVRIAGKRERTIRVNLLPDRMAALGVTIQDIIHAFNREHVQMPGGYLVGGNKEELINLDIEFHNLEALKKLIIAYRSGAPVRLTQIAEIEDGLADYRQLARFNDQPCVSIGIIKVSGSNTVAIVEAVKTKLAKEIIPQLLPGLSIGIASNDAVFIKESVTALEEHIVMGTLFAAIVVFMFLKSIRSTLIVASAIPVSLLGAIMVMYFSGYTFNKMTLLALLLLIGVVVDDAIVVLENVFRHREEGSTDPRRAALEGTNQVVFAVLAATFALACIFAPVIFMKGVLGRLFQAFAVVVTIGVLTSLFVSITLTPMLCSRYLVVKKQQSVLVRYYDKLFQLMEWCYVRVLWFSINYRWTVIAVTVAIIYFTLPVFGKLGSEFMPEEDKGHFLIAFKTPLGSSIEYTNDRLAEIEKVLKQHKEIAGYLSSIGTDATGQVSKGTISVNLKPRSQRALKEYELIPILREELRHLTGTLAFPSPVSPVGGGERGEALQFKLTGPELGKVAELADMVKAKLSENPDLGTIDLDLQLDLPQLKLTIDRTRVADLGLSGLDIAYAVNAFIGGLDIAKYNDVPGDGERYDIRLKAKDGRLVQQQDLQRIYLRSQSGGLVRLDTVARLERVLGPAVISRYDLQYAADYYASPAISLGEAVDKVNAAVEGLLPLGYTLKMSGRAEEFGKTKRYISFTFLMAVILLYMVLASQFNSFIQPLIIMTALPLAIFGGVFGLWIMDQTLNMFSMVGLVLLMGLVAKNSILLIDLTNQLRLDRYKGIDIALIEACPIRLRPVLMTAFTVILAMLPAAFGIGAGADTNAPLAIAVIGGMLSSTFLTLMVVPSVYSLVENRLERIRLWNYLRRRKRRRSKVGAVSKNLSCWFLAMALWGFAGAGRAETLNEAWSAALTQNHLLRAAEKTITSAERNVSAAKAARLPQLNLQSGYTVLDNAPASLSSGRAIPVGEDNVLSYQAFFSIPLYTHFRISRQIDAARSDLDTATLEETVLRQDIKHQVAEAYITVLRTSEASKVALSHEQSLASHARDVGNLYAEDLTAVSDLLAANAALADARQGTLQARNRMAIAKSEYNRILARPLDAAVELEKLEPDIPSGTLATLIPQALSNRLELTILAKKAQALRLQAGAVKAAGGPQVALNGGYDYAENKYQAHEGKWSVSANMAWNIFDSNLTKHKSLAITLQSEALLENRKDLESIVVLQVKQAWLKMNESMERIKVAAEALEQAEQNLNVARNRYQEGVGTHTEVLDAEALRTLSQSNYFNAFYDAGSAKIQLKRAIGDL